MPEITTKKTGDLTLYFGIEQGTQEWLELRKGRVTCSNAQLLMSTGVKRCIAENERAADYIRPNGNSYAERGHVIEFESREELNEKLSLLDPPLEIQTCTFITNSKYPIAGYSPDGLIVHKDDENWVKGGGFIPVEFKAYNDVVERTYDVDTPSNPYHIKKNEGEYIVDEYVNDEGAKVGKVYVGKHEKACKSLDNVPLVARCQMQMEMLMCDAKELFLVLANPDAKEGVPKVHIHHVEKDPDMCARIVAQLLKGQKELRNEENNV